MNDLTRRQLLKAAPALALAIAATLRLGTGDAAGADIAVEGGPYHQLYARAGLEIIKRAGWARFVQLNIHTISLNYDGVHGAELRPNTHSSRGTILLSPRFATNPEVAASLILHEAVHQSLWNEGIPNSFEHRIDLGWDGEVTGVWVHEWAASLAEEVFCQAAGFRRRAYRRPEHWR
ncbi:MAG: hypothetical protein V3V32_04335 [Dehalococcoidia bacterium]